MNIKNNKSGFTIVELLIVIVVIAILAAITIVAYNGITARANKSSAQSAAVNFLKKAEAYNADQGTSGYPTYPSQITGAASSNTYSLQGTNITFSDNATAPTTAPSNPSTLLFYTCGASNGVRVAYWDYAPSSGSPAWVTQDTGSCSSATYKRASATS